MKCLQTLTLAAVALVAAFLPGTARADVLELKGGQVLQGTYQGGTAGTVRFETAEGMQVIETSTIVALTFTGPAAAPAAAPAAPAAAPAASAASTPAAAAGSVTVPAGTVLLVRTVDAVSSKDPTGKRFAAKLDADLAAEGVTAAKAGTKLYGTVGKAKQAGRVAGKSELELFLAEIVIDDKPIPVETEEFGLVGKGSGRKTLGGAAVGAGLGATVIGGNSNDVGRGAALGAAATLLKPGQTVQVPAGTLLEFQLSQPLTLPAAR